ncbi:MAG: thiamine-phosphate kinase, partial [Acidobacteriota bacterium]
MQREFDFIAGIREAARRGAPDDHLILGIGDDTAVWRARRGYENLITTDLLVEDVDFKSEYAVAEWLGHKVLAVSLSDISAMGGRPRFSLLSLGIPRAYGESFWARFFKGFFALADRYGVQLIGGDTSASPDRLVLDSILIGECPSGHTVRRSGAVVGDEIYVTGTVGAAAVGLDRLSAGVRVIPGSDDLTQRALQRHLRPEPRVEFGQRLGECALAHAMIDISDGLAQDLSHICEDSGVSAEIRAAAVPVAPETGLLSDDRRSGFEKAVNSGEEFELIFTAHPSSEGQLMTLARKCSVSLTAIGRVIARDDSGVYVIDPDGHGHRRPLTP